MKYSLKKNEILKSSVSILQYAKLVKQKRNKKNKSAEMIECAHDP